MMRFPSCGMAGSTRERAPVARTICFASYSVRFPAASVTSTFFPAVSLPVPAITVILFFLKRYWMPLLILSATPRLRAMMALKSGSAPSIFTP